MNVLAHRHVMPTNLYCLQKDRSFPEVFRCISFTKKANTKCYNRLTSGSDVKSFKQGVLS